MIFLIVVAVVLLIAVGAFLYTRRNPAPLPPALPVPEPRRREPHYYRMRLPDNPRLEYMRGKLKP